MRRAMLALLLVAIGAGVPPRTDLREGRERSALPVVVANDNRTPAGTLRDGVLTLDLVVVMARWYPEAADGPYVDLPVFAEEGKAPTVPAPFVRVPRGTRLRLSVRNALGDTTIGVWGHGITAGLDRSTQPVAPGGRSTFEIAATEAGTFMYGARTEPDTLKAPESEQLAGAIVVDEPGARTDDRVLVINIWGLGGGPESGTRNAIAINGKAWPYTERFEVTQGDSLRWRVVNTTTRPHPMHLHGAYFRVDARGDAARDTVLAPAARRMVVTEGLVRRSTMRLTWSPETPGNWLFHCHLAFHVLASSGRLDPAADGHEAHSTEPRKHMAGLVLGIAVRPRAGTVVSRTGIRRLALVIAPGIAKDSSRLPPIGVRLSRDRTPPAPAGIRPRGDLILLTRGEPTDITVHNALAEPTAMHWHGLELESWSDGVVGVSGIGTRVAPAIAPQDSFTARLTLKRAGTFIYHTHLNDLKQVTSGLYGPLIVLEPGQRWDPTRDLVLTAGFDVTMSDGPVGNGGDVEPPYEVRIGTPVRMRFINIQPAQQVIFDIVQDGGAPTVARWRALAKDGYDLPVALAVTMPAIRRLFVGETFDAEFAPTEPGAYRLRMRVVLTNEVFYDRALVVR